MDEIQQLEAKIDHQHEEYLKLGYDQEKKLEALQLLKDYIIQYLNLARHADKFKCPTISMVLEQSVVKYGPQFRPVEAGGAFEMLSKYAQNLIEEPWREEYKVLRLCSGFFVHKISGYLVNVHEIVALMGYEQISNSVFKFKPTLTTTAEFDTLKRISRDLLVASQECIILGNIFDVVYHTMPHDVSVLRGLVHLHRQHYTGDVYTIARLILDKINPNPATNNAQNDTQTISNNTPSQSQSQIQIFTPSTDNNIEVYNSAFSNNKNYQTQSPLVKTKVSIEDLARCLGTATNTNHGLTFGVCDMENKNENELSWSDLIPKKVEEGAKSIAQIEADKMCAEALEYNCKVNEPFMYNNSRQLVNAATSTTCDKKGVTTTTTKSKSKCDESGPGDGSQTVTVTVPMDTDSNEHRPLDFESYYYNTVIARSKVPGLETEIERVPLAYINKLNNNCESGQGDSNSKALVRFPEPVHHIPEKQSKLSVCNNNEENQVKPIIDNNSWTCSHCTFTNCTPNRVCSVCYRKSQNNDKME